MGRAIAFWKANFNVHTPLKSQKQKICELGLIAVWLWRFFATAGGENVFNTPTLGADFSLSKDRIGTSHISMESSTKDLPPRQISLHYDKKRGTDGHLTKRPSMEINKTLLKS